MEKSYITRGAHWGFLYQLTCKYLCNTEYTSLFRKLLSINKTRNERKPSCYHQSKYILSKKCKRVSPDREWNPIDSSWFNKPKMGSFPFMKCLDSINCSINQKWAVSLLWNAMSLLIVKDTTKETKTFLKNVKWSAL